MSPRCSSFLRGKPIQTNLVAMADALRKADPAALAQAKADYQEDYQTWTAALFLFEQQWSEIEDMQHLVA